MPKPAVTTLKLVVTGPFNAGKTTLISTISEIPVLTTETGVSDAGRARKKETTVSMDFGRLTVPGDPVTIELAMFGTPGQARFDFMWNVLAKGMLGYVLMVDATDAATWEEARGILQHFTGLAAVPCVVAANRCAGDPATVAALRSGLRIGEHVAIVPCQALNRESAKAVLLALLMRVLAVLEARERTHAVARVG